MPAFKAALRHRRAIPEDPPARAAPEGDPRPVGQDRQSRTARRPTRCTTRSTSPTAGSIRSTTTWPTPRSPTRPGSTSTTSSRAGARPPRCDGKLYGMPFDGEATIQFYRKDIYDQHGIEPARDLRGVRAERGRHPRSGQPALGRGAARLRRPRPEHVHLSVDLQGVRRRVVRCGRQPELEHARGAGARSSGTSTSQHLRAVRGRELELARPRRRFSQGTVGSYIDGHHRLPLRRPGALAGRRQDGLTRAGRRDRRASA